VDSFLLFVEIGIYAVVFVATPFAAVRLFSSEPPRWLSRIGALVLVAALAEVMYLLRAPACIYLPRAPGHRMSYRLLGVNAQHELVLIAQRRSLGFLWGPRWYFEAGDAFNFGFEIVRPLRYDREVPESASLVVGDRERPYPNLDTEARVLRADGCLLGWTGGFRPKLHRLDSGATAWRLVTELPFPYAPPPGGPVGPPYPPSLRAVNTTPAEGVIELYQEAEDSRQEGPSRLILLERDEDGREISRSAVALPRVHKAREGGQEFTVVRLARETLIFESSAGRLEGHGLTYSVSPDGVAQPINAYEFAVDDSGSYPRTVSSSADGAYFTTGQAVFRRDGTKIRDLHPTLGGCVWDGYVLYGVRWYRFSFGYDVRRNHGAMEWTFEAARRRAVEVDPGPSLNGRSEAWRHGEWFMNGVDEAGRDDEVVAVSLPLP
jgi:hypothetical protein